MDNKRFLWRLFYPYLILILVSLLIFGIYASHVFKDLYISRYVEQLKREAYFISEDIAVMNLDSASVTPILKKYDKLTDTRITLVLPSGKVLSDSRDNPSQMDNHSDRPEVIEALKGNTGYSLRFSHSFHEEFFYIAVPVYVNQNKISSVLRTSTPSEKIESEFSSRYYSIILGGIGVLIFIAVLGLFVSMNVIRPLMEIKNAAVRFARGDFAKRIFPPGNKDLKDFAESLNTLATQLNEQLNIIGNQKNIQQAVLESMKEGVIASDFEERIVFLNNTAAEILSISGANHQGQTLQEVVRVSEIHKFFRKIISEGKPLDTEIIIQHEKDQVLQLTGTILHDSDNKGIGVLVVLNDISNLKYLDNMKRDLVANVSHELKTPITAIKGFTELLKEGAMNEPENSGRFLQIISKHTERLNAIIEDLLTLSRLEQTGEVKQIRFEEHSILSVIKSAVGDIEYKAQEKKIDIEIHCSESLTAKINRPLMEQALRNLLDNAVKYSPDRRKIKIKAVPESEYLICSVADEGFCIAKEHFPRLFERFYRIDKSRSRDEGGTGLGLAIVKHIAQVHGGSVEVESEPGKGSIFTIRIPLEPQGET